MSVAHELIGLIESSKVPKPCAVGSWIKEQPREVADVFEILKTTKSVNKTEALNVLRAHYADLPFARTTFVTHLRGECPCVAN